MARIPRQFSESNLYHVVARGVGRQNIFECPEDCQDLLKLLRHFSKHHGCLIHSWCLMSNHFHILVEGELESISCMMRDMESRYACSYNEKYEHAGHLFQGRYRSKPISSDAQLLATIRYIHLNPVAAGKTKYDEYRWSSYHQILSGKTATSRRIIDFFGGKEGYIRFHAASRDDSDVMFEGCGNRYRSSEEEVAKVAESLSEGISLNIVKSLGIEQRDRIIVSMRAAGLSIKQIERLTGIGRGVIQKAKKRQEGK